MPSRAACGCHSATGAVQRADRPIIAGLRCVIQLLDADAPPSTASGLTSPSLRATLDTARATAAGAQRAGRAAVICTVIETAPDPLG